MKLVVVEIRDHCQGADIVTHGLRLEHWSPYGPSREVAQKAADVLDTLLADVPQWAASQGLERST